MHLKPPIHLSLLFQIKIRGIPNLTLKKGFLKMRINSLIIATTLILLSALSCPATSSALEIKQRASVTQRPNADKGPTEVQATLVLIDIDEIDSAKQNFAANIFVGFSWKDPRLSHKGAARVRYTLDDIWHPQMQILNRGGSKLGNETIIKVSTDGTVLLIQRFVSTFSNPLDLKDFPLDSQTLRIDFISVGYTPDEITLVNNPEEDSRISEEFALPDWHVQSWRVSFDDYSIGNREKKTPMFSFQLQVKRDFDYFLLKIIFPLVLIVAMSWSIFWIDPAEAGSQIGVSTTSMLTLIAYRFAIDSSMPRISYLTRLDIFILTSTIMVFLSLIQAIYTSKIAARNRRDYALKIDRRCRIAFPVLFAIICLYSFLGPV